MEEVREDDQYEEVAQALRIDEWLLEEKGETEEEIEEEDHTGQGEEEEGNDDAIVSPQSRDQTKEGQGLEEPVEQSGEIELVEVLVEAKSCPSGNQHQSDAVTPISQGETDFSENKPAQDGGKKGPDVQAPNPEQGERKEFVLSQWSKLLIRDGLVLLVAIAFPFMENVQEIGQGSQVLIPIITLILALIPPGSTCIGQETSTFLNYVLTWPLFVGMAFLTIVIAPHSLGGFLTLTALVCLVAIWLSFQFPSYMLVGVVGTLVFSFMMPSLYNIYNLQSPPPDDPFKEAKRHIGGVTFSFLMAPSLHFLGAVVIFPWRSETKTKQQLANALMVKAKLLRSVRWAYQDVGRFTMFPEQQTKYLFLPQECLDDLKKNTGDSKTSVLSTHSTLIPTLFETRWYFSGRGHRLVIVYKLVTNLVRHARAMSEDLLAKYNTMIDMDAQDPAWTQMVLESEKKLNIETLNKCEDRDAEILLRKDILQLSEDLNVALEKCCQPLAALIVGCVDEAAMGAKLAFLKEQQAFMDNALNMLEAKALRWSKSFIRAQTDRFADLISRENLDDPFYRSKLITYILTLRNYVHSNHLLVDFIVAENESKAKKNLTQAWDEWKTTFTYQLSVLEDSTLRKYTRDQTCGSSFVEHAELLASGIPFRMAIKLALGTTFLSAFAYLPQTHVEYTSVGLVNAVFTFQVIIYKLQTGLVFERTLQRLGGILAAYLYAGVAWELSCIGGCTALHGWSLYILELPALILYLWVLRKDLNKAYAGFAFVRTYSSLISPLVVPSGVTQDYWRKGGFIVVSSFAGAVVALILGLCVWPTSGRRSLRKLLARTYEDYLYLTEEIICNRYIHYKHDRHEFEELEKAETMMAKVLFIDAPPLLRAAKLETMQNVNFDAPFSSYETAVESTKDVWRTLWKFHHIGGIRLYLRDSEGNPQKNVSPTVARNILAMNRALGTSFSIISATLNGNRFAPLPILRPVLATPALIKEAVDDFVLLCYGDKKLMNLVLESNDLHFVVNLIMFRDNLLEIGRALAVVFDFLENFVHQRVIKQVLREEDARSFENYSHKKHQD